MSNNPIEPTEICKTCGLEKPISEFSKRTGTKKGIRGDCKDCINLKHRLWWKKTEDERLQYSKKYYANNREKIIKQKVSGNLKYRRLARLDCIEHYSNGTNACACCGENHLEFMSIDHINGNGRKHREHINEYLPLYLKRNGYPKGYRILCHNCNLSIGFYGYCPHEVEND